MSISLYGLPLSQGCSKRKGERERGGEERSGEGNRAGEEGG
jgi:hypothetical protein